MERDSLVFITEREVMLKQWWDNLMISSVFIFFFSPTGFFHGKIIKKCRKGQMSLGSSRKTTGIPT